MGSGARCYIGTLFSVVDAEAEEVVGRLFGPTLGMELATALARSQASVYGDSRRRPYVMVGCHFQRIRKNTREDSLTFVKRELQTSRDHWRNQLENPSLTIHEASTFRSIVDFLESELRALDEVQQGRAFRS